MAITLLEFADTKPVDGTINVLMSSSRLDSANMVDYVIKAMTIPHQSDNSIDVEGALNQLNDVTIFQSGSNQLFQSPNKLEFADLNLTRKAGYVFIQFDGLVGTNAKGLEMSASTYSEGHPYFNHLITGSDQLSAKVTYLEPFVEGRVDLSEYHANENNATKPENSHFHFKVDRDRSQLQPNNLEQITASLENVTSRSLAADVQESNYSTLGWIRGRYDGSKLYSIGTYATTIPTKSVDDVRLDSEKVAELGYIDGDGNRLTGSIWHSSSFYEDDPSMNFISFEGSRHDSFADDTTIKAIDPNERQLETFYFNFKDEAAARIEYSSSTNNPVYKDSNRPLSSSKVGTTRFSDYSKYPTSGSHIYDWDEETRRYVRVPSSKLYLLETGRVLTTNEKGAYISSSL